MELKTLDCTHLRVLTTLISFSICEGAALFQRLKSVQISLLTLLSMMIARTLGLKWYHVVSDADKLLFLFRLLDKEEGKTISLGTSKLNYLDPRISVAWTKKWDVPVEKVYNKTQKEKFQVRLVFPIHPIGRPRIDSIM